MNLTNSFQAVIFDLDGTLMDTVGEIHAALALAFVELRIAEVPPTVVESLVGRGVRSLVERALERQGASRDGLDDAVHRFEHHYAALVATKAVLFPGALDGLRILRDEGLPLAVVTNKPRQFTVKLLEHAGIDSMMASVVAGDDGITRKPAGDMLLAACRQMGSPAAATLMIGDSANDVLAARAAGCPVWCVPYGYTEGQRPETLACDRLVATIAEAARLIVRD
ncbi:HAD-IA family hydrolase [Usitatibacter palustris]|uniref:Phosphoglycolate phosphatase n=1 Tax=Usitatibacter palustris TaxID=2732487 RepID=A0A6M4H7A0_9PROT|nr:HAD-IA family hydrolase [Usitatibacter palustris]QJR15420.1 Phosphoglycolate phosphatase [Usitatibacter palustris]